MKKLRKRHSGEGYIDVCVLVVCAMLVLALVVRVLPVFVAKQQLDTYAVELVREAEISGRVGTETNRRAAALTDSTGLDPNIRWSKTGRIQLNEEVTVTLTLDMDIGLFGGFGSFPITILTLIYSIRKSSCRKSCWGCTPCARVRTHSSSMGTPTSPPAASSFSASREC